MANPWLDDGDLRLFEGDALTLLRQLPTGHYHTIVTSPPFHQLRDYGHPEQLGSEDTPEQYAAALVEVFHEARRVLRDDGCLFLEIGDSYAYKQLQGIPWRLAFALQADDWILRSEIIWEKPNCMPESVTDRPTRSHSTIFLFAKSSRYFFDAHAISEPHHPDNRRITTVTKSDGSIQPRNGERWPGVSRNARSVWTVPTQSTPHAHFATMAEAIAERCINAGTSEQGCCPTCGAAWERITETTINADLPRARQNIHPPNVTKQGQGTNATGSTTWGHHLSTTTKGWAPCCTCNEPGLVPCRVLDPFCGSGTTLRVARRLGRHADGLELSRAYLEICAKRIGQPTLWSDPQ